MKRTDKKVHFMSKFNLSRQFLKAANRQIAGLFPKVFTKKRIFFLFHKSVAMSVNSSLKNNQKERGSGRGESNFKNWHLIQFGEWIVGWKICLKLKITSKNVFHFKGYLTNRNSPLENLNLLSITCFKPQVKYNKTNKRWTLQKLNLIHKFFFSNWFFFFLRNAYNIL